MIAPESILYRLPAQLDRKQALFFDGIRHAAEIADIAHARLQVTLTRIARTDAAMPSRVYAEAYLDAWALVDVIDRFRLLLKLLPNADLSFPEAAHQAFQEVASSVRDLRNVADHLAQRAEYVLSRGGTALGSLNWFTISESDPLQGMLCVLVPGTTQTGQHAARVPAGKTITIPTGHIHLSAGEHAANLSLAYACMSERVNAIEKALDKALGAMGLRGQQAGADLVVRASVAFRADRE